MAVLALTCVRRDTQRKMGASTQRKISGYIASLANKIQAEGKQGLLGNVFSTGEAMQVSQKANQETENGVMAEGSIFLLPLGLLRTHYPPAFVLITIPAPAPEVHPLLTRHTQYFCAAFLPALNAS